MLLKKIFLAVRNIKEHVLLCWILIAAGIYTVAPFLLLAKYNQPSADDYTLANRDRLLSLPFVLRDVYANWSGRFLAPVFSRLNPLLYNIAWCRIYPVFLIIAFIISVVIVFRELLRSRYSFFEVLAVSSLFIHLVFSQTPSISEAFYWFSGSCIYQTSNIFTLLLIALLSKLKRPASSGSKAIFTFLAGLLCIFIIGSNEVSMVIVFFIVVGICVNDFVNTKKIDVFNLILLAICILCAAAVFFAPGNLNRINDPVFYNRSPLWAMSGAAAITGLYLLKWGSSLLSASLVYLLFTKGKANDEDKRLSANFNIKATTLYFVSVFIMLQVTIIYIAGGGNLGRIENNVYLLVLIGYFFNLHLFLNKFQGVKALLLPLKTPLFLFTTFLFLFDVFNLENNTSTAYVDLVSGRAKKYKQELDERLALVKMSKADTCYVPALSAIPKSLFVNDIGQANDSIFLWINRGYADYYHVSFVLPSGPLPLIEPNVEIIRHLGKEIRKNMVRK